MNGFIADLQTMAALHFAIFVFVVGSFSLYFFYLVWKNFRRARIVEDTPTARVRSAPQGYVELEGVARMPPGEPLLSALTRTPCVWFRFRIERESHNGRSGSSWSEVESGSSETPFVLHDETGKCLVDPRGAEVTAGKKQVWYGNTQRPSGDPKRGFFGELLGGRYRYTEERIGEQDVYILGWFDTLRSTDKSVEEELSQRLRTWKQDYPALLRRFDSNRDGEIDSEEWHKARQQAHREVIRDRAARSSEAAVNVVRTSEQNGYPFLVSASPQFLLGDRYRRRALFALIGCVAAVAALAGMLVARF